MFLRGGWATDTFVTNYFPLMLFPVLFVGARLWWRQGFIKPEDMDFKTGLAEALAASCVSIPRSLGRPADVA